MSAAARDRAATPGDGATQNRRVNRPLRTSRLAAFSLPTLVLLAATLLLTACGSGGASGSDASPAPATRQGGEWTLTRSSVSSADLGAAGITATFDGTQVGGFSGVNQYSGPYSAGDDGSFKAGPLGGTMMAGPEPLMKAEQAYLDLLSACDSFKVEGRRLTLSTGAGATLVYERTAPAQLPDTTWDVTGYNNGKEAVVGVEADSSLTIAFGADGTVSGHSGVNTYRGPFQVTGATVKIGPLGTTEMAGPKKLMDQEAAFLAALQNAREWTVTRGKLELRDTEGALQVTADAQP